MRYLAVGDIHGCFRALTTLASFVPFQPDDLLITLGDYVNRGPDSRAVLDWLINYRRSGRLIPLRGNHEIMMQQARENEEAFESWLRYGGDITLASYSPNEDSRSLHLIPDAHWNFIDRETRSSFEISTHFFVHANVYPDMPLVEQPEYLLYWEQFEDPGAHESGKIMVCGHTPQKSGVPRNIGHAICIDTWACGGGWLTCLDVISGRYWQANERGDTRSNWLV